MKTKRKWLALAMAVLCMAYMAGCGKGSETGASNTAATLQGTLGGAEESKPTETAPQESGNLDKKNTEDQKDPITGLPEGYVYDYQVSLEPIPKEIADLGGTCVGTMHAFPSRIMVGLMKQRMEEEPEFKKEAERKTEEVRKALEEEIGGEFEVELRLIDTVGWEFLCREISTDYKFTMYHIGRRINSHYYDKINAARYEEAIQSIISGVYDNCCQSLWFSETGGFKILYICIANFTDGEISYSEEQKSILNLWKGLQQYDEEIEYQIHIEFYPTEYEGMVHKKYCEGIFSDLSLSAKNKEALKMNGEIYDSFVYDEIFDEREQVNMSTLLEEYENGTYDETKKWEYWIKGGEY